MSAQRLPAESGQVGREKVGRGAPFELHEVEFRSGRGPLVSMFWVCTLGPLGWLAQTLSMFWVCTLGPLGSTKFCK